MNKHDLLLLPPVVFLVWAGFLFHSAMNSDDVVNWISAACVLVAAVVVGEMCRRNRKKMKGD